MAYNSFVMHENQNQKVLSICFINAHISEMKKLELLGTMGAFGAFKEY